VYSEYLYQLLCVYEPFEVAKIRFVSEKGVTEVDEKERQTKEAEEEEMDMEWTRIVSFELTVRQRV